jgi:AraC-like DNA-binding protein
MYSAQLHIKNMVCGRCLKAVSEILDQQGFNVISLELGKAYVEAEAEFDGDKLAIALEVEGFELIDDDQSKLINLIKSLVIQHVHHESSEIEQMNISAFLEKDLGKSYSYLSSLFSKAEGRTIEKYVILQRIERVKELLIYGDKTISEIAFDLGYSSSQYLSNQFKAETGLTPSEFRNLLDKPRKAIDEL